MVALLCSVHMKWGLRDSSVGIVHNVQSLSVVVVLKSTNFLDNHYSTLSVAKRTDFHRALDLYTNTFTSR